MNHLNIHRFNLNQTTGYVSGMWLSHYTVINRANRLITAAQNIVPDPNVIIEVTPGNNITEVQYYNTILAQAKALRAYSYFQLLTYFSPDLSDDEALGVMLFENVPASDVKLPRVKNGEVFSLIESDLLFAENNLVNRTDVAAYKFVTKNMINSLMMVNIGFL